MEKSFEIKYKVYKNLSDLPTSLQTLYKEAKNATQLAYAPYSNFLVGAAVELDNGKIITGSNQENAAYPSGLCAERNVMFHIGATYKETINTIAIAAKISDEEAFKDNISPCGACRQVMSEYEIKQSKPISFLMPKENGSFVLLPSVNLLLPFLFDNSNLQ